MFVRGFDSSLDEDTVRAALQEAFGAMGEIKSIRLPSDREAGTLKGMGYIEFDTTEARDKAAAELNGTEVAGGELFVDGNVKPRPPRDDFSGGGGEWIQGNGSCMVYISHSAEGCRAAEQSGMCKQGPLCQARSQASFLSICGFPLWLDP